MPVPPPPPPSGDASALSCFFRDLKQGQTGFTCIQVCQVIASRESSQKSVPETGQQSIADLMRGRSIRSTCHMFHEIVDQLVAVDLTECLCDVISNFGDIPRYHSISDLAYLDQKP